MDDEVEWVLFEIFDGKSRRSPPAKGDLCCHFHGRAGGLALLKSSVNSLINPTSEG